MECIQYIRVWNVFRRLFSTLSSDSQFSKPLTSSETSNDTLSSTQLRSLVVDLQRLAALFMVTANSMRESRQFQRDLTHTTSSLPKPEEEYGPQKSSGPPSGQRSE